MFQRWTRDPGIRRLARHISKGSEEAGRVVVFAAERKEAALLSLF
jgi:hypothetical protein